MAKTRKPQRPKARQPRGFRDLGQRELARQEAMLTTIRRVYDRYGFAALETPAFEFSDALGKFLPDDDRPNAGVFSLQDDDEQWLSLRYDLTAPLARYVAENYQYLPKPFRRYAVGPVWRNEKPGPGRYRQFTQFDADTVGSDSIAADAEICMLAADTLEALDIARGDYRIRVNNRKVLDAVLVAAGIDPFGEANVTRRLTVLRAMDKFDRFGAAGVALLLGGGRKDESGDFTPGAELPDAAIAKITDFLSASAGDDAIGAIAAVVGDVPAGSEGIGELEALSALVRAAGYDADQIAIDPSIVRGLDYYTGPVMEADLTFEITSEDGRPVQFGSVGGGGRYDDLVARFTGQLVPATGFSLGVSRLAAALDALDAKRSDAANVASLGPVVVLVMDRTQLPRYQAMAAELRRAGIKAEMYVGTSGMKAQMKYADKRNAPCVVIEGETERSAGEIQIKDLVEGARLSGEIATSDEWRSARPAQVSVPTGDLVKAVGEIVARYQSDGGNR